jgi:hypothetical protein
MIEEDYDKARQLIHFDIGSLIPFKKASKLTTLTTTTPTVTFT